MALGGRAKERRGSALSAIPGHFYAKLSLLRSEGFLAYSVLLLTRFGTMSEAPAALTPIDIQPVKEPKPEGSSKWPQAANRTSGEGVLYQIYNARKRAGKPEPSAPASAFESCLHQLGVEQNLRVVGEELGDRAAALGVGGGLGKGLLRCAGNAGRGGQRDARDSEAVADLAQRDRRAGFDLLRRVARCAQLRAQRHREAPSVRRRNQLFGRGARIRAFKARGEGVLRVAQHARRRRDRALAFLQ